MQYRSLLYLGVQGLARSIIRMRDTLGTVQDGREEKGRGGLKVHILPNMFLHTDGLL